MDWLELKIVNRFGKMKKRTSVCMLGMIFFLGACQMEALKEEKLPYYTTPDFMPHWIEKKADVEKEITHRIAAFSFTNQENKTITNQELQGKIHVANFFFTTCPSVCPKMTIQLQTVQKAFEKDTGVVLMSYSVTPWIDSTENLKKYSEFYTIIPGRWHLLTGNKSEIYELARKSYFAEEEIGFTKDSTEFLHTEHVILVDRSGRIRGIYNGTLALETERLIGDIRSLQFEQNF